MELIAIRGKSSKLWRGPSNNLLFLPSPSFFSLHRVYIPIGFFWGCQCSGRNQENPALFWLAYSLLFPPPSPFTRLSNGACRGLTVIDTCPPPPPFFRNHLRRASGWCPAEWCPPSPPLSLFLRCFLCTSLPFVNGSGWEVTEGRRDFHWAQFSLVFPLFFLPHLLTP